MPEIELVATHTDDSDRTYYEPVVASVGKFSDYNKEQFSLTTPNGYIKGYWQLTPKLKERMSVPPIGTKAEWYLSTKPKTGEKAKPGSVYCDVVDVRKVPDGHEEPLPVANEQDKARPAGAIKDSDPVPPEWSLPREYWEKRQALERRSIQMQTAFNGLVALLNGPTVPEDGVMVSPIWSDKEIERMKYQVRTLVLMLVPGLPESEGAQQAKTDAEDLSWAPKGDEGATGPPWPVIDAKTGRDVRDITKPPTQAEMATGVPERRATH